MRGHFQTVRAAGDVTRRRRRPEAPDLLVAVVLAVEHPVADVAPDALVAVVGEFPLMAGGVEGAPYRWRALEGYVAVYSVDEAARRVTLMRLFHMSADWRARLLGSGAEG